MILKVNKIIITLILLLSIFMIGSVCACENITDDNLSQIDNSDVSITLENDDIEIANDINITFDNQMWKENLSEIKVQLPENATGTFCLKIGTLEVYNQTINNKTLSIPVKLPKPLFPYIIENIYPPRDCTNYKVTAFYNDIELNLTNSLLSVMNYPPNYEYLWGISSEVIQYDTSLWNMIMFPRSANGIAEIYVDGKLITNTTVKGPYVYYNSSEVVNLALGNHTMKINYYGDTYYHDANKNISFEIVNVKIDIPQKIYIGHDDCISVDVLKNTSGTVKVYIDSKLIYTGVTENGNLILSLEKYLKFNSSHVTVEFIGKEFSREKTVPINITYDFGYYDGGSVFTYGEENIIEMILPDTLNNKLLTVTINGTDFTFTHPEYYMNNIVEVDVSKLDAGNYTINITYPGDDKFYTHSESYNFSVIYRANYPYYIEFGDNSSIYLNLPSNAAGNLTVYVDGTFYKTVKLAGGKASIRIDDFIPGNYNLTAMYSGDDYDVKNTTEYTTINPKIISDYFFTAGQDKSITVKVPKNCSGYVIFYVDDDEYNVTLKNGQAKFSYTNLDAGKHLVYVEYYGDNGFKMDDENLITIYKPRLKIISSKIYTNGVNVKIKVIDNKRKAIKNAQVTFKINGKKIKAKTNSKGIATVKSNVKLQAKKYKVTVTYNGGKISKTVKVKHVLSLKKVTVRKSAKSITLTANLKQGNKAIKSKVVAFKFNGKTFKAKTNSKGIAKVTIKNILNKLAVGKTVKYQASYLKDTVKKTSKVKK